MLKELLKPEINALIEKHKWGDLRKAIDSWPAPELGDLLLDIDKSNRVLLFRALPRDLGTEVFSYMEHEQRDALLLELTDQETKQLLEDMPPDERTALLEELPDKVTRRMLNLLSPEDLKEARELLGYPEDSIGRLMTPDFVALRPEWTVARSLEHIRKFGRDSETLYRIYITDKSGKLLDDILLRYLIIHNENDLISDIMDYSVTSLSAFDDQEEAVHIMEKYDISALPVVDSRGHLVGIVTFDDIMDVSSEEATEDFQKISAINPVEQSYLSAGIWKLTGKRLPWLMALLLTNFVTAGIMSMYSDIIELVVTLTFFIPLIIGTAGNTGTQSSTLIIRSLATGDVELSDWLRVFRKELVVGMLLGAILGLFAWMRGYFDPQGDQTLALVIAISVVILVLWANLAGALLPVILQRFKLDPAVISSPFIATLIDVTGIIVYFNIAMWFLM